MGDSTNRKTAKPLTTLRGVEPDIHVTGDAAYAGHELKKLPEQVT